MRAGILRDRVTIQRPLSVQDQETGEQVLAAWESVIEKLPAGISYLSGKELIAAQAEQSEIMARITIRFRSDIDSTMRVLLGDKIFDIKAVLPDNNTGRTHLTLFVSEGVNNG